jgi:AMMECR1 domain-containing protein
MVRNAVHFCLAALLALAAQAEPSGTELIALARAAVRAEVAGSPIPRLPSRSAPTPVFLTIERKAQVLGCRGSLEPRARSLEEEIVLAARAAAAHDPRYRPLTPKDLEEFQVTVTLVRRLEPIESAAGLTPAEGLVLRSGSRVGVVLPWEGRDAGTRLKWAYRKAGVPEGASVRLYRLIAERFKG